MDLSFFFNSDTDRRYRATEKLLHAEDEYREILCSARELYARPLARNHPEFHDVIFQPLADLARSSAELCKRVRLVFIYLFSLINSRLPAGQRGGFFFGLCSRK